MRAAPPILAIQPSMETIDGIEEQSKHRDIKTQASGDEWYGMNEPRMKKKQYGGPVVEALMNQLNERKGGD